MKDQEAITLMTDLATFNYPQFRMRLRGTSGDENLNSEESFVIRC